MEQKYIYSSAQPALIKDPAEIAQAQQRLNEIAEMNPEQFTAHLRTGRMLIHSKSDQASEAFRLADFIQKKVACSLGQAIPHWVYSVERVTVETPAEYAEKALVLGGREIWHADWESERALAVWNCGPFEWLEGEVLGEKWDRPDLEEDPGVWHINTEHLGEGLTSGAIVARSLQSGEVLLMNQATAHRKGRIHTSGLRHLLDAYLDPQN